MFRNILVHIPSERPVRPVIDVAVALTLARRAHLDAVAIGYESMSAVGMVVEGGAAAVASVMEVEQDRALERAKAAITVFEVEAKLAKIAYGTRVFAAIPADAEETDDFGLILLLGHATHSTKGLGFARSVHATINRD